MNPLQALLNKVYQTDQVDRLAAVLQQKNGVTVFTNGCFDLIHRGHIEYLCQAAALGDQLVIGLNTDESVRRLKGMNRPIIDEMARAMVLASMEFVDFVVLFDEDTPYNLIRSLQPHILVKGSDYTVDQIVGSDLILERGGKVETLDFIPGYSTTAIEERIRKSDK